MSFMKPYVVLDDWLVVETNQGSEVIQASIVSDDYSGIKLEDLKMYCEAEPESFEVKKDKYGARLSASGFMDRTDWTIHDTEEEARKYLKETYPEDEDG